MVKAVILVKSPKKLIAARLRKVNKITESFPVSGQFDAVAVVNVEELFEIKDITTQIQKIQGVKIGILGIINSKIHDLVLSENLQGIKVLYEKPTLEKWIPVIKKQGAEIIIVLTSSSIPWDREAAYENFVDRLDTDNNGDESSLNAIEMGYFAHGADIIVVGNAIEKDENLIAEIANAVHNC